MAGSERANEAASTTTPAKSGASSSSASATAFPAAPGAVTTASPSTAQNSGPGQRRDGEEGFPNSSGASPPEGQALIDGLRCDLLMNARYHSSREAFLDTVHRVLMFLIIVLGAAAVSDLLNAPWVKGAFAACASVLAAFDLTADLSNRARTHALMKRRYFELLADLTAGRSPAEVEAQMHRCSADEEPAFHALLAVSWNAAQEMVYGNAADRYEVPRLDNLLKNIRRYGQKKYRHLQGPRVATA